MMPRIPLADAIAIARDASQVAVLVVGLVEEAMRAGAAEVDLDALRAADERAATRLEEAIARARARELGMTVVPAVVPLPENVG
jgi:hypothetical protein